MSERLRQALEEADFHDLNRRLNVTTSIGVAEYQPGEEIADALGRADANLYRAKESGRNRVVSEADDDQQLAVAQG